MKRRHLVHIAFLALCALFFTTSPAQAQWPDPIPCKLNCNQGIDTLQHCEYDRAYVHVPWDSCATAIKLLTSTGFTATVGLTDKVTRIEFPAGFSGPLSITWMQKANLPYYGGATCVQKYYVPTEITQTSFGVKCGTGKAELIPATLPSGTCGLAWKLTAPDWFGTCTIMEWQQAHIVGPNNDSLIVMFSTGSNVKETFNALAPGIYTVIFETQDKNGEKYYCPPITIEVPPVGELVHDCREPEVFQKPGECPFSIRVFDSMPIGNCASDSVTSVWIEGPGVSWYKSSFSFSTIYPENAFNAPLLANASYTVSTIYTTYGGWSDTCFAYVTIPASQLKVDCGSGSMQLNPIGCGNSVCVNMPTQMCENFEWQSLKVFNNSGNMILDAMSPWNVYVPEFCFNTPLSEGWYHAQIVTSVYTIDPTPNESFKDTCWYSIYIPEGVGSQPTITCPTMAINETLCGGTVLQQIPPATAGNTCGAPMSWHTTVRNSAGSILYADSTNGHPAGLYLSAGTYTVNYTVGNYTGIASCQNTFVITNSNQGSLILDCSKAKITFAQGVNCRIITTSTESGKELKCGAIEWGKAEVAGVDSMFMNGQPVSFSGLLPNKEYTITYTYLLVGDTTLYTCKRTFTTPGIVPSVEVDCSSVNIVYTQGPNCTITAGTNQPITILQCGVLDSGTATINGVTKTFKGSLLAFEGLQPNTQYSATYIFTIKGSIIADTCTLQFTTPPAAATFSMNCDAVIVTPISNGNCNWSVIAQDFPVVTCGTITSRTATMNGVTKSISNGQVKFDQLAEATEYTIVYNYTINSSNQVFTCTKVYTTPALLPLTADCLVPSIVEVNLCERAISVPLPSVSGGCVSALISATVRIYDPATGDLVDTGSFTSLTAGSTYTSASLPSGWYNVVTTVINAVGQTAICERGIYVTKGTPSVEVNCSNIVRNIKCDGSFDLYAATAIGYCGAQLVPEWILNSFVDSTGKQVWMFKFMPDQPQTLHVTADSLPAGTYTLNVLYYTINDLSDSCAITVVIPEADPCCDNMTAPLLNCKSYPDSIDICDPLLNIGDSVNIVINPNLYEYSDDCTEHDSLVWMAMIMQPGIGIIAQAENGPLSVSLPKGSYVVYVMVRDPQYNWSEQCAQVITVYCSTDPVPIPIAAPIIRLAPNPTSSRTTISIGEGNSETVTIMSTDGRIVWNQVISEQEEFDASDLRPGIYLVSIPGTSVTKLVVTK